MRARVMWFVAGSAAGVYASVKARRAAYRLSMPGLVDQAAALGWVQRVFEPGGVLAGTLSFARRLARESSGESLRMMKRQLFVEAVSGLDAAYRRSVDDMNGALRHPDFREGLRALRERRPPNFLAPGHE